MPVSATVFHALSMTSPDDPLYANKPSDWNSAHAATFSLSLASNEAIKYISAGTLSQSSGTINFANSNGVSWGLDTNGQITGSVKTDYQSQGAYLTTAALSQDSSKYAGINGAIAGGSITLNTSGVSINLPAYLTTAALSGDTSKFAGTGYTSTSTGGANIVGTLNTSGLSLAVPQFMTAAIISAGTTAQHIANWSFSDANGVSWQINVKTISASVNTSYRASNDAVGLNTAQSNVTWTVDSRGISLDARGYAGTGFSGTGATATLNSAGLQISVGTAAPSPINFSAGSTSGNLGSVVFADSNGVTWGLNGSTITATVQTNYLTTGGLSQDSSKYAGTGTSATNASITLNTNGLAISVAAPGGGATISSYENMPFVGASAQLAYSGVTSLGIAFNLPQAISASFLRLPVSFAAAAAGSSIASTGASANASVQVATTFNLAIYSLGVGASSRSLMSVLTTSAGWTYLGSLSALANGTQYSITQAFTGNIEGNSVSSSASYASSLSNYTISAALNLSDWAGVRMLDIPLAGSLAAGAYWALIGLSTTLSTNSVGFNDLSRGRPPYASHYLITGPSISLKVMGSTNNSSVLVGAASFTTGGGGTTANLPISALSTNANMAHGYFQLLRSA